MELQKKLAPENYQNRENSGKRQELHKQQEQQNLQSIKNLHQLEGGSNKSASELFDSISNRIRVLAGRKMSEVESREAARRFINFCQLVVDCKIKQNIQSEEEDKYKNELENSVTNSATATNATTKSSDVFCKKDQ